MTSEELAIICAEAADEIQAEQIKILDLRGISTLTDFMIICSGMSMPHLKAILREIATNVEERSKGERPNAKEGKTDTRWVVLDYIDVMIHIMHEEMRELYALEELWGDAPLLDWQKTADPA